MGLLDRLRGTPPEEPWRPPPPGMCACPEHVDALTDLVVAADPPVTAAELAGAITVTPSDEHYVYGTATGERRGPYEWRLTCQPSVMHLYDADAPASIDDMLFIQPGIDNVLRLDETILAVGAREMCALGITAAFVTALANPRVRRP